MGTKNANRLRTFERQKKKNNKRQKNAKPHNATMFIFKNKDELIIMFLSLRTKTKTNAVFLFTARFAQKIPDNCMAAVDKDKVVVVPVAAAAEISA